MSLGGHDGGDFWRRADCNPVASRRLSNTGTNPMHAVARLIVF
ncbi:hypothetical protein FRUB_01847 [Fimbriiglobus ruber]|uniref:Uncharacterized protein n=1 Tax=Fimbriiglobus ruber TaxID=1908690 RepID=A0A225E5X8_9BACT|nr:hypothetical protein FRUB_01847 [Fimbriiglobus ruber]